jgi:hypothetical protein
MRRRDLIAGGPAALLTAAGAQAQPLAAAPSRQVDVCRDFGAVGDGVADDWRAIEAAGLHLERLGGGRMYFPTGKYRVQGFGRNITVRSNVEYFGDGHSSVIIGSNAAFISPQGAAFGRSNYHTYNYYPLEDIKAGDQFVQFKSASDAANFRPGDIVIARSANAIVTPGDTLPYYVEMNRVRAIRDNRLELEDTIDDGWRGPIAANVTHHVAQGYSIHDLRVECDAGYPFFIQGSYKSFIRNCWTRGYALACFNAFTRSMAHDIQATVIWQPDGITASLFEIETGSVRANFHDIDVYLSGSARPGSQYPLFYCQEFSRRTLIRNIRVAGAGVDLGKVAHVMSGGHRLENIEVTAKSIDKILDYVAWDPSEYQLNSLGLSLLNVSVETQDRTNGFNHGFVLHNDYPAGVVQNVTIIDCSLTGSVNGTRHNLIWFYKGRQRDILFDSVRGPGFVAMNNELANGNGSKANSDDAHINLRLRNCEYTGLDSEELLRMVRFVACTQTE